MKKPHCHAEAKPKHLDETEVEILRLAPSEAKGKAQDDIMVTYECFSTLL